MKNGSFNGISVKINGKESEYSIGDRIKFGNSDKKNRFICSLRIDECGTVAYLLEWFDDGELKSQWVSSTEIKLLDCAVTHTPIGFS